MLVFVVMVTLLVAAQLSAPKPVNWTQTFSGDDKNPYGAFVLYSRLADLFPDQTITPTRKSIYELFRQTPNYNDAIYNFGNDSLRAFLNLVVVEPSVEFDSLDARTLLQFAAAGNSVFIAASRFENMFADTLRLETENSIWSPWFNMASDSLKLRDTLHTNFSAATLRRKTPYQFSRTFHAAVFTAFDTARTTVLGTDEKGRPNFIRVQFGRGAFYLCSNYFLFTNYHVLSPDGADYAAKVLSHLPVQETLWDEYYKPYSYKSYSPLRFVLDNDSLRYAYYLSLVGILLFIFVEGKRRQRIIPIVTPPTNSAMEFTETVGRVYFQHGDHKNLAEKKIEYFLDHLRAYYYLNTAQFTEEFYQSVSEKSEVSLDDVKQLFLQIKRIQAAESISADDLLQFEHAIEQFYNASTIKPHVGSPVSKSS